MKNCRSRGHVVKNINWIFLRLTYKVYKFKNQFSNKLKFESSINAFILLALPNIVLREPSCNFSVTGQSHCVQSLIIDNS